MASEHGEIRYDRADMLEDCRHIADLLDVYGRASFKYAAFGTLHVFSAIEARKLLLEGDRPLWVGGAWGMPEGISQPPANSHTLWVKLNGGDSGNKGVSAWLNNGGLHVPFYLAEKFCRRDNPTDGLGLGVLFLLVEAHRDVGSPDSLRGARTKPEMRIDIEDTIKTWVAQSPERDLPAFMTKGEHHG